MDTKELLLLSLSPTLSSISSFGSELLQFCTCHPRKEQLNFSRLAMLDQQEKGVFFPFQGGEGKLRPKESWVCPVPFSEAGFSGEGG